jgi:hypothetical protein
MNHKLAASLIGTLIMISIAEPAYAYLDPATGSIMIQAVLGAVAGGTLFFRTQIFRLKSLFTRTSKEADGE